jgi:8-oxo-dGTP pyrophosphatase MutT (NUDIX family)
MQQMRTRRAPGSDRIATVAEYRPKHNLQRVIALAAPGTSATRARERWHSEQSAALPYRWSRAGLEVMLVTSRTTRRWVLPKGSVGSGMSAREAALAEAYEEAGVGGQIGRTCIGIYGYTKRNERKRKRCLVKVFPLRVSTILPEWPERRQRRRQWVTFRVAGARVQERALRKILFAFERQQLHRASGRLARMRHFEPSRCSVGRSPNYISYDLPVANEGVARGDCLEAAGWAERFLRGKAQGA